MGEVVVNCVTCRQGALERAKFCPERGAQLQGVKEVGGSGSGDAVGASGRAAELTREISS